MHRPAPTRQCCFQQLSALPRRSSRRLLRPSAIWLDNVARVEAPGVPLALAYSMWQQKSSIPRWMPWITSVTVQQSDPRLSRWALSTEAFGQKLSFSWLARDLTPILNQKIHWVAAEGLANRGSVLFFPRGTAGESCALQLSISYELPEVLQPLGDAVRPVVEGILLADMQRFVQLATAEAKKQHR